MTDPNRYLDAYLDGQLTPEQLAKIETALCRDPGFADDFAAAMLIDSHLKEKFQWEELLVALHLDDEPASAADNDGSLSAHDVADALGYALQLALTSKPAKKLYAWTGIAAALLLAVTLLVVFTSDKPDTQDFTDNTTNKPAESAQPILRDQPVATLTATHDATWAERASARGSDLRTGSALHPNQTLTLTAGFAEITTTRGAVAILQAPATVELIDNDNAIQLHSGKLVGICETESSKGFLVRTPHMDITDLGTRFGVVASKSGATEVHVFEGEVQARRPDAPATTLPTRLIANQSARTSSGTNTITRIDHDADRFAALLPTTTPLPGTGFGLKAGDTDPNWQIVAIDGKALDTPQAVRVSNAYGRDVPNDPAAAQWLAWDPGQEPEAGSFITYTFRTRITLPESIDPATSQISLRYAADNQLRSIRVNGQPFGLDHAPDHGTWIARTVVLGEHLRRGENTIEFEVANYKAGGSGPPGEVGLHVRWELKQATAGP